MADQLTLGVEVEQLAPFDGTCPVCREHVLVVMVQGVDVVAEFDEVLEQFPCPQCSQVAEMGHDRGRCVRCGNAGVVGEPLPVFGVAVDAVGRARYFTGSRVAGNGEAVHREHVCRLSPV